MQFSKRSLETLIDLVENKLTSMEVWDRGDRRELLRRDLGGEPLDERTELDLALYFDVLSSRPPEFQVTRKIDTKLAGALFALRPPGIPSAPNDEEENPRSLPRRNLRRYWQVSLPSGQAMARALGLQNVLDTPDKLGIRDLPADAASALSEHCPLWYYILKEAEVQAGGSHLGALGSVIVCAVFSGLLRGDPHSWLNVHPCWEPDDDPLLTAEDKQDGEGDMEWTLAAIIRLSGLPVDGDDFGSGGSGGSGGSSSSATASATADYESRGRGEGGGKKGGGRSKGRGKKG